VQIRQAAKTTRAAANFSVSTHYDGKNRITQIIRAREARKEATPLVVKLIYHQG
jgi:hypothetical protein